MISLRCASEQSNSKSCIELNQLVIEKSPPIFSNLCKSADKERITSLLEAVKPFWKDAPYKSSHYDKDRVKKCFPNLPTDNEGLQKALASFS